VQGLLEFIRSLGAGRIAAMGVVALSLIGFFTFLILRVTAVQMTPLFTDLTFEDSAAVVKELDRQVVPYELRNDGTVIMVPKDRVGRLRMSLASEGLPKGGGVGYEIFDKSDALGTTSFVQNINNLRALEGELARTISALDRVQSARVHLVLPERPLFSRDKVEPSASIVLKVRGSLEQQQVRAIRHLVASAVNGLKPQRVSVVDEAGRLLADGVGDETTGAEIGADERRTAFEKRLREQVETIVSSVVGPGRARVEVSADFDFNRITQTSDKFDPDGRVVRSSQSREETSLSNEGRDSQVTVGNEIPNGNQRQNQNQNQNGENPTPTPRDQSKKTEEIVNYEISKTTKTEVIEGGRVNRISLAVLVDGTYAKNEKGDIVYQPRSKEELELIGQLVRSAIGFDQKRGDQVQVVNLRFAENPVVPIGESSSWLTAFAFTKDDIMRAIEMVILGLLGIVVLVMVVRPVVRRALAPEPGKAAALPTTPAAPAEAGKAPEEIPIPTPNPTAKMIDVAQIQGQVHAQSVQKVGELADKNPREALSIIRQWMNEPNAA
jgi:flagellar M-ring protein FliF